MQFFMPASSPAPHGLAAGESREASKTERDGAFDEIAVRSFENREAASLSGLPVSSPDPVRSKRQSTQLSLLGRGGSQPLSETEFSGISRSEIGNGRQAAPDRLSRVSRYPNRDVVNELGVKPQAAQSGRIEANNRNLATEIARSTQTTSQSGSVPSSRLLDDDPISSVLFNEKRSADSLPPRSPEVHTGTRQERGQRAVRFAGEEETRALEALSGTRMRVSLTEGKTQSERAVVNPESEASGHRSNRALAAQSTDPKQLSSETVGATGQNGQPVASQTQTRIGSSLLGENSAWWLQSESVAAEAATGDQIPTAGNRQPAISGNGVVPGEGGVVDGPLVSSIPSGVLPGNGGPEGGLSVGQLTGLKEEHSTPPSHPESVEEPAPSIGAQTQAVSAQGIAGLGNAPTATEAVSTEGFNTSPAAGAEQDSLAMLSQKSASIRAQAAEYLRMSLRSNRREILVRLDPPELGRMNIRIQQTGNRTIARIAAQLPEVENLLRDGAEMIRNRLNSQGMRVDSIVVEKLSSQAPTGDLIAREGSDSGTQNQSDQSRAGGGENRDGLAHEDRSNQRREMNRTDQIDRRGNAREQAAADTTEDNAVGKSTNERSVRGRLLGVDIRA